MCFEKSAQELIFQLNHDEDLLGRIRAARELSVYKSTEAVAALLGALQATEHYGVQMAAALSLGEIGTEDALTALTETLQTTQHPAVRRACVCALGQFKDDGSLAQLRDVVHQSDSYFVQVAAVRALAKRGGERSFDILKEALAHDSWQQVVACSVFHGWAQAKEKRAADLALEYSAYGKPVPLRLAAIGCLGTLGKELQKDSQADRLVDALCELLKDKNIRARVAAVRALGKIGNKRALGPLREMQQRECLDQLKGALLDALAGLEKQP